MTYADAKEKGYKDGRTTWQRGYISRKTNIENQPVNIAGGTRKGEAYILVPSWRSTSYCHRRYLIAPNDSTR
jgi:hypothetical protein